MNEFLTVSAEELEQVAGGFGLLVAAAGLLLDGGRTLPGFEEPGEPLPGFDKFLAETKRISGLR
ncbi:MAG: hypothetical protein SGJ19_10375 [Planctomycetia bacterium]|nr:hypothetical protein [Planctomycetia bacterium]